MHSMPTWSAAAGSPCRPAVRSPASTRRSVHENTFTRRDRAAPCQRSLRLPATVVQLPFDAVLGAHSVREGKRAACAVC